MRGSVLIVDDDLQMGQTLATALGRRGLQVEARTSGTAALDALRSADFDAVVTDLSMPFDPARTERTLGGIELCDRIAHDRPDIPVIVITAFGSLDTAVAAIRAGAYDFITKPIAIEALVLALDRAIQHRALREEVRRLRLAVEQGHHFGDLLGSSPPMQALFGLLARASESEATVLVTGETGSGKELVARALHQRGRRARGPFLVTNCAALPAGILESELFGHVKGAFTDARTDHTGLFVRASGGTLVLDEIGDMPLTLQPKLLRALEDRRVTPVGAEAEVAYDARIIASTHRDLESLVEEGRFREDLYFRVNVIHIPVPPLRARGGDILLLAQSFLERFAAQANRPIRGITSAASERLLAYDWPGNVRELQNCIERAVALTSHEQLTVEDLPEKIRNWQRSHIVVAGNDPSELLPMDEVEKRYILRVLEVAGGKKSLAAQILGFDRTTLYRKLERFGVPVRDKDES